MPFFLRIIIHYCEHIFICIYIISAHNWHRTKERRCNDDRDSHLMQWTKRWGKQKKWLEWDRSGCRSSSTHGRQPQLIRRDHTDLFCWIYMSSIQWCFCLFFRIVFLGSSLFCRCASPCDDNVDKVQNTIKCNFSFQTKLTYQLFGSECRRRLRQTSCVTMPTTWHCVGRCFLGFLKSNSVLRRLILAAVVVVALSNALEASKQSKGTARFILFSHIESWTSHDK